MKVIIIGAGLGGLTLAQGLHTAGIDVTVYERDPDPFARGQGYRIHLDPEADEILEHCLPPRVYQLYRDTSGVTEGGRTFLMNEQLAVIADHGYDARYNYDGPVRDAVVDRLTFRQALSAGLTDIVRHGKACTGVEHLSDDGVRALFADGSEDTADVLIGADGIGSAVRRQLLPDAPLFDTGLRLIYGKTPLTGELRDALPTELTRSFAIITGPEQVNMALGWYERRNDPSRLGADVVFPETGDYLMWGLVGRDLPTGTDLLTTATERTASWHPALRSMVARCVALTSLTMRSSAPTDQRLTGAVTLLGDAAHAMFPAGSGTLVALRDVRLLLAALREVAAGATPLEHALRAYESDMYSHAWPAVRESYEMAERLGGIPWDEAVTRSGSSRSAVPAAPRTP